MKPFWHVQTQEVCCKGARKFLKYVRKCAGHCTFASSAILICLLKLILWHHLTRIHLHPDCCGPTIEHQIQFALLLSMSVHTHSNKYI